MIEYFAVSALMSKKVMFIARFKIVPLMFWFCGIGTPHAYGILSSTIVVKDFGSSSTNSLSFLNEVELILLKSL